MAERAGQLAQLELRRRRALPQRLRGARAARRRRPGGHQRRALHPRPGAPALGNASGKMHPLGKPKIDLPIFWLLEAGGLYWAGTGDGVFRFDLQHDPTHYTIRHGIAGREIHRGAGIRDRQGRVVDRHRPRRHRLRPALRAAGAGGAARRAARGRRRRPALPAARRRQRQIRRRQQRPGLPLPRAFADRREPHPDPLPAGRSRPGLAPPADPAAAGGPLLRPAAADLHLRAAGGQRRRGVGRGAALGAADDRRAFFPPALVLRPAGLGGAGRGFRLAILLRPAPLLAPARARGRKAGSRAAGLGGPLPQDLPRHRRRHPDQRRRRQGGAAQSAGPGADRLEREGRGRPPGRGGAAPLLRAGGRGHPAHPAESRVPRLARPGADRDAGHPRRRQAAGRAVGRPGVERRRLRRPGLRAARRHPQAADGRGAGPRPKARGDRHPGRRHRLRFQQPPDACCSATSR